MDGNPLIKELVQATGLPEELVYAELDRLAQQSGKELHHLGINELRVLLATYLIEVFMEAETSPIEQAPAAGFET